MFCCNFSAWGSVTIDLRQKLRNSRFVPGLEIRLQVGCCIAVYSEINAFHVGWKIIKEQDIKEDVKQTDVLNGGKTFYPAREVH